jgi:hypothetical protein
MENFTDSAHLATGKFARAAPQAAHTMDTITNHEMNPEALLLSALHTCLHARLLVMHMPACTSSSAN